MAPTPRSAKRRKVAADADPVANGTFESSSTAVTPSRGQLKRPSRASLGLPTRRIKDGNNENGVAEANGSQAKETRELVHLPTPSNGVVQVEAEAEDEEENGVRTSGRTRRRPRRYSGEMEITPTNRRKSKVKEVDQMEWVSTEQVHPEVASSTDELGHLQIREIRRVSQQRSSKETQDVTPTKRQRSKKVDNVEQFTNHERKELINGDTEGDDNLITEEPTKQASTKKRGRPKGSKNKPRAITETETAVAAAVGDDEEAIQDEDDLALPFIITDEHPLKVGVELPERQLKSEDVKEDEKVDFEASEAQVELIKSLTLSKLTGKRLCPLVGLNDEYEKVSQLVQQTILAGEGNSILVIGARGTGKSALVNKVLQEAAKDSEDHFHVIRLNGFIHTDDKVALREIWRQLGREMQVEDDAQGKSYSDILSKLLALLSHPSELSNTQSEETAKSVVFVLDEFDLFATHPRQTLLYNLFDIAQSRKAPIAVLGLTTRVDIAESLEKRVKSRFSHRYVHLTLPKSFKMFEQICKAALQFHAEELNFDERALLSHDVKRIATRREKTEDSSLISLWNASIVVLLESDPVSTILSRVYHTTKSVPTALSSFLIPTSLLSKSQPLLKPSSFTQHNLLQPPDSKLHLLRSLPTLALALLIAAARLDVIFDTDTCNFNMSYDEYSNLVAKSRASATASMGIGGKVWGKEVSRGAWERLLELELLLPATGGTAKIGDSDMVRCDVALEEIEGAVPSMEAGLEKWCREI